MNNNHDSLITKKDVALGKALLHAMKESKKGDCPSLEDIASLVEGRLGEKERERVMAHLSSCDKCYETFLLTTQIKEKRWKKRPLIFHPVGLAASVIIVAFLAFLVYKSGFFPGSETEISKKSETVTDYSIPKEELKTVSDKKHGEKEERKKMKRGKGVTGETFLLTRKKGGPAPVSKKGVGSVRKKTGTEFKREKMAENKGYYKQHDKKDHERKAKEAQKPDSKMRMFQETDRSVQTPGKNELPPKKITEQQVQPKVIQKTASDEMEIVQKEKTAQKGVQQGVVHTSTMGDSGRPDRANLRQSSVNLRLYCSDREGDSSTQFPEHQSLAPLIEKIPVQVQGILPDKGVFPPGQQWGLVVIEVEVDSEGNVKRACALKGDPELARQTIDEILKWKYEPVHINGKPSPVRFIIKINYK